MHFEFSISLWWILPGIALAAGLVIFLYRKDSRLSELKRWQKRLLIGLRSLFLLVLAFLLLGPLMRMLRKESENPLLIVAQDNSASVTMTADSTYYREGFQTELQESMEALSDTYEPVMLRFGEDTRQDAPMDYSGQLSDYSRLYHDIEANYGGRHIGAVVLAGDGIYNHGMNPALAVRNFKYPVYTIAMGDSMQQKDVLISETEYNKLAFKNVPYPVRVHYRAYKADGEKSVMRVYREGKQLYEKRLSFLGDDTRGTVDLELEAETTGLLKYELKIEDLEGEVSRRNNRSVMHVEVIDNQQQILVLYHGPHPDVSALRHALTKNKNFNLSTMAIEDFSGDVSSYNLVILHQLPSKPNPASQVLAEIKKKNIPYWMIFGNASSYPAFNSLGAGLQVNLQSETPDEAQPVVNEDFAYFDIPAALQEIADRLPPLVVAFAEYRFSVEAEVLFTQKLNRLSTGKTLFSILPSETPRKAFLAGEGIWRWRMMDYRLNGSHEAFDALVNKTAQFLVTKRNARQFSVQVPDVIPENQPVSFEASFYNDAFELDNSPEAQLTIIDSTGKEDRFDFNKGMNTYRLNAGNYPQGQYRWEAECKYKNTAFKDSGYFAVAPLQLEALHLRADHKLLAEISERSGGKMFYPGDMGALAEHLENADAAKPLVRQEFETAFLLNLRWIFFVLLGMIATEWFFRKFWGTY